MDGVYCNRCPAITKHKPMRSDYMKGWEIVDGEILCPDCFKKAIDNHEILGSTIFTGS